MAWGASTTKSKRSIDPVVLTTTAQTIYIAPSYNQNVSTPSATAQINVIVLGNANTTGTITYTIYLVPSGGTAGAGNAIMSAIPFQKNPDTAIFSGIEIAMNAGDTLQALASTTGVNIALSVEEYQ